MFEKKRKKKNVAIYVLIGIGLLLSFFATKISPLIEAGYSRTLYKWLSQPLSLFTGLLPFSLAEFIVVGAILFGAYKIIQGIALLVRKPREFFAGVPRLLLLALLLYVGFNLMWGLNYSRLSFAEISGLSVEAASVQELEELAMNLTQRANQLREQVSEDSRGVMVLFNGSKDALARAELGYQEASKLHPELGGKYGKPKRVLLSRYWSYTGIAGAYFPFTAEANFNTHIPHLLQPSTISHEMAHQRGFAREDEANFIAYLTCTMHPDADFQYSGTVLALTHTMSALHRHSVDAYREVQQQFSPGLSRDLQDWNAYWTRFEGPMERAFTNINDTYLKANRQQDGVHSYGRMVDLLLADYKQR